MRMGKICVWDEYKQEISHVNQSILLKISTINIRQIIYVV